MKSGKNSFLYLAIIVTIFTVANLDAVTRLAFSRPGGMMRVPTTSTTPSPYLFSAGFSTEVLNFSPYNSAAGFYFDTEVSKNLRLGLSSVSTADTTGDLVNSTYQPPMEIGFHLQYRIWKYGNISFSIGLHDVVLTKIENQLSIDSDLLSYLGVIASEQTIGNYFMSTYMGFGTGALAGAAASTEDTSQAFQLSSTAADTAGLQLGVFAGFLLKTPVMAERGGMDVMGEFDGSGINVGIRVPITSDYKLQFALIHAENLPQFGQQANGIGLKDNDPSVVLALSFTVPRIAASPAGKVLDSMGPRPAIEGLPTGLPVSQLDSALQAADVLLAHLRDSLRITNFEVENLHAQLAQKDQSGIVLLDSVRAMQLRIEMIKSNMNYTMQHLSASWQHYYEKNYRDALQEIEMAIQLSPDLAIAYARRGSIYYKLGDIQRATINWNLALKQDPEYDDVRNILRALKENRLKATSLTPQ